MARRPLLTLPPRRWDSPPAMAPSAPDSHAKPMRGRRPLLLTRAVPSMRAASFAVVASLALSLATSGCGGEPPPKPRTAATVDPEEQARIDQSRKTIDGANAAMNERVYDRARKLLAEAKALDVESHRFEIGEAIEKIDKREAKLYANEAAERFEQMDCLGGLKELADKITALESEAFTREVRRLAGPGALQCIERAVADATKGGRWVEARALVGAPETKIVLGSSVKKVVTDLHAAIELAMVTMIRPDIDAQRWADAMAKLDAAMKKGDADEALAAKALGALRVALAPKIGEMAVAAIAQPNAAKVLAQVDELIRLARWEIMAPDVAELAKEKALPSGLARKRDALATWVEAARLRMKPVKRAERMYTWGKVAVLPAASVDAPSKRDLAPSVEVWVLGRTKDRALVADADPGAVPLAGMLERAAGWVPSARLSPKPTYDKVPPDDQLPGTMVWAPLRPPDALLELGTVTAVTGNDVQVKRLADDQVIQVGRKALRSGRLAQGIRVVTHCTAKDQVAEIDEVLTAGRAVPAVRVKCPNGSTKEELFPSLRTRPDLLAASKPAPPAQVDATAKPGEGASKPGDEASKPAAEGAVKPAASPATAEGAAKPAAAPAEAKGAPGEAPKP